MATVEHRSVEGGPLPTTVRAQPAAHAEGPRTHLGESPRWDGESWWWVDASAGEVWTRKPGGPAGLAHRSGVRTSLVQPAAAGRVVIAREQTLVVLERRDGDRWDVARTWCDLGLTGGWLVNDGVADAIGRLWIGSIAPGRSHRGGALLRVDPDGRVTEAARGFSFSNGMAWDTAGSTLFHVDTPERKVWAHRIDVGSGEVLGSETFVTLSGDDGLPDGIATDIEDGVWIAVHGRGEVRRYDASGRVGQVISVEPPQCTSVALGGHDGRDLLITTAREGYDDERSLAEPAAGRLYEARASVPGVPHAKVLTGPRP
jgi:xylono-1,5-lactonase